MTPLYLQDLHVGDRFSSGHHVIDEPQILRFARESQPQPFPPHSEAAKGSMFGGLAASGWHTAAITMRLMVEGGAPIAEGLIGAGGEIKWTKPTRPGDTLQVHSEVIDISPSRSRPDRGTVTMKIPRPSTSAARSSSSFSRSSLFRDGRPTSRIDIERRVLLRAVGRLGVRDFMREARGSSKAKRKKLRDRQNKTMRRNRSRISRPSRLSLHAALAVLILAIPIDFNTFAQSGRTAVVSRDLASAAPSLSASPPNVCAASKRP